MTLKISHEIDKAISVSLCISEALLLLSDPDLLLREQRCREALQRLSWLAMNHAREIESHTIVEGQ